MPGTAPSAGAPPQVGAPDPSRDTSPILAAEQDELSAVEPGGAGGACWFNGERYAFGEAVRSGDELLRCERPGVWVRLGEWEPQSHAPGAG